MISRHVVRIALIAAVAALAIAPAALAGKGGGGKRRPQRWWRQGWRWGEHQLRVLARRSRWRRFGAELGRACDVQRFRTRHRSPVRQPPLLAGLDVGARCLRRLFPQLHLRPLDDPRRVVLGPHGTGQLHRQVVLLRQARAPEGAEHVRPRCCSVAGHESRSQRGRSRGRPFCVLSGLANRSVRGWGAGAPPSDNGHNEQATGGHARNCSGEPAA